MHSFKSFQQISRPALLALALFTLGIIALTQQSFVESMSLLPSPSKLPQPGVSPTTHSDIYGGVVTQSDPCAAERARLTSLENELRQLSNIRAKAAEIAGVREAAERRIQKWRQRNDPEVNQLRQRLASPQCQPTITATRVHVTDENGSNVAGAEVFAEGAFRGVTNAVGRLDVTPPLANGARLVARKRILESHTDREHHNAGSTQDWKMRIYITSMPVNNDSSVSPFIVSSPLAIQELQVRRENTLIGLHLVTSVEWDASQSEMNDIRDKLINASQFLYNATDGQFLIEQAELVDNAAFWDEADVRVYANLSLGEHVDCPRGGFFGGTLFCGDSWIHVKRTTDFTTYAHEFGHYGFDLGDEYKIDDSNVHCTRNVTAPSGPFRLGQPMASCMMWHESQASKLCSNRPENRHVAGTREGDHDCWTHLFFKYCDYSIAFAGLPLCKQPSDARWLLRTPNSRGAIVGQIHDGLSQGIPVRDWVTRVSIDNRSRPNLCAPITLTLVDSNSQPTRNASVTNVTSYGQVIIEGNTDRNGLITITGAHVGDGIWASSTEFIPIPIANHTVTSSDCVGVSILSNTSQQPSASGL